MKTNKLTSALVALGIISLAGAAQANTVIYLTGSTAARAVIYAAATTQGQIFTNATVTKFPSNASGSTSTVNYEGYVTGIGVVDLNCNFTGSEAGIATVAGASLTQVVNGGTYSLPGVGNLCTFLDPNDNFATNAPLANISLAPTHPDLTMADTSQTVSQTSKTTYPLTEYGIVGVIPFTFAKGYMLTPNAAWNHFFNVTTAAINQNLSAGDNYNANNYTGVASDNAFGVAIVGRNFGSGTRANILLNAASYGLNTVVKQASYGANYNGSGGPGVLNFSGGYTSANNAIVQTGNDGYDSGGSVQKVLNVDGTGSYDVMIGYLGISDAAAAIGNPAQSGQPATALKFNGVIESDANVINGSYTFWGQEHLYGSIGQSSTSAAGIMATNIVAGIAKQLTTSNAGTAAGDLSTVGAGPFGSGSGALGQSYVIPLSLMQVHRTSDTGFPVQGNH